MTAYIRPVCRKSSDAVTGYALVKTEGDVMLDCEILDHYGPDYTGKMIRESAAEFHGIDDCQWAGPLYFA